MGDFFNSIFTIIYPRTCHACGKPLHQAEEIICLACTSKLPKTNFHLFKENIISDLFVGRFPIIRGTSFLFFRKHGIVQHLIYQLKYQGAQEVGIKLGELFGEDLKNTEFISAIDYLIPVPLHPRKLEARGFNQSELIGRGLEKSLGIPLADQQLIRTTFTESQTRKSMFERWENVSKVFQVKNPEQFKDKHILLLDDVVTTGSTMEACMRSMAHIPGLQISVAVLAKPI